MTVSTAAEHQAGNWRASTGPLRREFREVLDLQRIRALHATSGVRHALVAFRQLALGVLAAGLIVAFPDRAWIYVPCTLLLGLVVFSLTVLLHEDVHHSVFRRRNARRGRWLAWLYALPSGLSPTQFARWHLDHHAELGTEDKDPKRHSLTPKRVNRWYKALYLTPALFPIYFRAAAREAAHYPIEVRARIRRERRLILAIHLAAMAAIGIFGGIELLCLLYVIPVFFVFPVAFTINRLGQHYDIEPDDPAAWGTLVKGGWFWNFFFLWSNYHLEHHYFPGVPFYNLPRLHEELCPLFRRHGIRERTYSGLLYDWFVKNKVPHTHWH